MAIYPLNADIRVLISEEKLQTRIREIADEIARDYKGKELVLVCILKGSIPFFADLTKVLSIPIIYDYLGVSSYEGGTESTGIVRFLADLSESINGRHVLLVEDIVDTGLTMNYLLKTLSTRNPASLEVVSLLNKQERREKPVQIKYCGFDIPNEFVVGYGLDYEQFYRNLPFIGVMNKIPEPIEAIK